MAKRNGTSIAELERFIAKLTEQNDRTSQEVTRVSLEIDRVDRQVGALTNGWGKFVEDLVHPGVGPALRRFGYQVQLVTIRCKSFREGRQFEVDTLALATDAKGRKVVLAAEVRSHLDIDGVKDWIEKAREFFLFYPEYQDRDLELMVAGIRVDEQVPTYAIKHGLFILVPSGETVTLANPDGFTPAVHRAK